MIVPDSRNSGRQRSGRSRSEKFILPRWHSILGLGLVWTGTAIRIGLWNLYQTSVVLIEVTENSSSILVQWLPPPSPSSLSEDRSASNVATRERRVVWSVETTFDGDEDKDSSTDKVDTVTQLRRVRR
mmetsp:Transcript_26798/g.73735  ORF Transcript_26798/g.73735 Transcript_26798/m.73735 type:complete len:128 (-) Transcript_26798:675-1058(-)|eukprot:CAMPEP_0172367586 /NCGR_PEP_ID=MMETSP1060-20121228/22431_1 /TAXON_ID=37318 /ORGANISM="Pseudo-nitzschia pungens, Strain cf. cingulata" /LENGTH=127 /DNA_ID=CAMNT_0013091893 /DNA_START=124 /DNA_END=507 /DNA_ORIENTATION=+